MWFAEEQTTLPGLRTAFNNLREGLTDTIDGLMLRHDLDDLLRRLADVVKCVMTAAGGDKEFFASTLKSTAEADARHHLILWLAEHPLGAIDHIKGRSDRVENAPPLQDVPVAARPGVLDQIDTYHDAIAAEVVGLFYHRIGANPYTRQRMEEALRRGEVGPGGAGAGTGITRIANRADFGRVYTALCADAILSRRPFYGDSLRSCAAAMVASESTAASASRLLYDLVSTQATRIERHLAQVIVNQQPFPAPAVDMRALPRPAGIRGAAATNWEEATRNHLVVTMSAIQATAQTAINSAMSELRSNIAEYLAMADATGHHSLITPEVKHEVMALQAQRQGPAPPRVAVTHLAAAGQPGGPICTNLDKVLVTAAKALHKKLQAEQHVQPGGTAAAEAAGTNGGAGVKTRRPPDTPPPEQRVQPGGTAAAATAAGLAPGPAKATDSPG